MEDRDVQDTQENNVPRTLEDWQDYMAKQLRSGHQRMDRIERTLGVNNSVTEKTSKDVEALRSDIKTFLELQAFGRIGGKFLMWLALVGGGIATIWGIFHGKAP